MAIKVGNKEVANIFIGSTPVKSVYKGNTKIWASEGWHTIFDTETTWEGNTWSTTVFASTTNESKKFRITYNTKGGNIRVYKYGLRNSETEYTDEFEISETGNIWILQAANNNINSGARSEAIIYYNTSTKEFSIKLKKEGNINIASITLYKIEQFF